VAEPDATGRSAGRLRRATPILPARDVERSAAFYRDQLSFAIVHTEERYGIVERDDIQLHLRGPSGIEPSRSDAMIRVEVEDLPALYRHCAGADLVHPNAPLHDEPWGTREFAILDRDGNLVTFFEPR
jgi:catechol 2,3-dioxygenase-like lactoylglutathione lyase family enzyme